ALHRVKRGLDRASAHGRGKRRGGAPEGERADRKARAASADATPVLRLSALRLPSFCWEAAIVLAFVRKTRMQKRIARTRSLFFPPPRQRGRGTAPQGRWRGRRRGGGGGGAAGLDASLSLQEIPEQKLGACVND